MQTPPNDTSHLERDAYRGVGDGLLAHAAVHPDDMVAALHAAQRTRRHQRVAAFLIAFVVLGIGATIISQAAFTTPGGASQPALAVSAEATAALIVRPGAGPERIAPARPVDTGTGALVERGASARHAVGEGEAIAVIERAQSQASLNRANKRSTATASAERISLLGGRVELTNAKLDARADSSTGSAAGTFQLAPTTVLTVDGVVTPITANQKIGVADIGTIIINEQAVLAAAPKGDAQTGPRARVVGAIAHVRLTSDHAGLPAGTQVVIGRVDAGVREGKVKPTLHPGAETNQAAPIPAPSGIARLQAGTPRPGEGILPRQPTVARATTAAPSTASLQNYTFPILGATNFSNDWGGPRASTGIPHQGTDVFADEGTPIVAAADGVLDRVGWNSIGGYRFWLFDRYGNSFYHAHLSAYSPLAQDGAQVKAGDVIGFVGHTGDAQGTPPHLHFEIHPGNGGPTNPFPFLNAWQRGVAVAIGLLAGGEQKPASLALLGFSDISANSGLQGSVLDSVPDTSPRPVDQENVPQPTDSTLKDAIEGPGTTGAQ